MPVPRSGKMNTYSRAFWDWHSQWSTLAVNEAKRLWELETESNKLKKLSTDKLLKVVVVDNELPNMVTATAQKVSIYDICMIAKKQKSPWLQSYRCFYLRKSWGIVWIVFLWIFVVVHVFKKQKFSINRKVCAFYLWGIKFANATLTTLRSECLSCYRYRALDEARVLKARLTALPI